MFKDPRHKANHFEMWGYHKRSKIGSQILVTGKGKTLCHHLNVVFGSLAEVRQILRHKLQCCLYVPPSHPSSIVERCVLSLTHTLTHTNAREISKGQGSHFFCIRERKPSFSMVIWGRAKGALCGTSPLFLLVSCKLCDLRYPPLRILCQHVMSSGEHHEHLADSDQRLL